MSSIALGAEKAIIFISDAHEKFYYEKLKEVGNQAVIFLYWPQKWYLFALYQSVERYTF